MLNKNFIYFLLVFFSGSVILTSCVGKRDAAIQIPVEPNQQDLSERQNRQFDRYYFEGLREKTIGNYDRAEQNFIRAHKINKNNASVNYELALIYYSSGFNFEALPYARQAVKLQENNFWYNLLYAGILKELDKFNEVLKIYDKLIKLKPNDRELYLEKASIYILSENYKAAISVLDKAEEMIAYDHDIGYGKFSIYLEMNQLKNAIEELEKLSRFYPSELYYKTLLADVYFNHNMEKEGFAVYLDILKLEPENGRVQMAIANFYMRKEQRDSAMIYYRMAFINPELEIDSKIMALYALYLADGFDIKNKEEAFELSELITIAHPDEAKAFAMHGDFLYQDNQLEEAKSYYLKSIELDKSKYAVWQNILSIYLELRDFQKLTEAADETLIYFPNQPFPYFLSGIAHSQLEKFHLAISMYESALNLITDNKPFASQIHGSIADVYYQLDEQEKCDIHFDKSLELNPDNATALNNYSYYLALRNERLEEAEKMSARSLELEPENPSFLDTYGWVLYKKGDFIEAEKWISKAWEKSPESHEVAHHYGDVLFQLGRIDDAISFWEIAISLGGDEEKLNRKIENKAIYEK